MSEKDAETIEVSMTAPRETAPVVEGMHQQETCADLAQASDPVGTQTPVLKDPETSELTSSPNTDSGYAETVPRLEIEEEEDSEALHAAPLHVQLPSPEPQPAEPTQSPDQDQGTDTQPEFEGDMVGTSSPVEDSNVFATPAATPPSVHEGEDGVCTPPGALSPIDDPQLRVSPKRKVENMELDVDSSAELPALEKKAWADPSQSSAEEEYYQWDVIPPPKGTDRRLASRFPWGNEAMVLGKPFSEYSHSVGLSPGRRAGESECAAVGGESFSGGLTGGGACAGETESLYSAASDLTQVMISASPSQPQLVMMGAKPKGSSCSVDSRHSDFASPPRKEAIEQYRTCAGRMMLDREDWTHYAQQDEARPGDLHLEWPESLRTVGPRRIPAGYEGTYRQEYAKPHAPTFHGRVLRRKHGIKSPQVMG